MADTHHPSDVERLREQARQRDAADPLRHLRSRFDLPDGLVYLDGNSLGALPHGVADALQDAVRRQWGSDLIGSWTSADWWGAPGRVGDRIAPLVGAAPGTVVVTDSTSVDLFKLVVGGARLAAADPHRTVLLVDEATFPTDRYLVDEAARLLGMTVRAARVDDPAALRGPDGTPDVAVAVLCHVDFRTGELFDLPAVTRQVQQTGALVLWDLCHSAGAVDVRLADAGVDLAVGCGYKFLNGGPGAPAFVYVAPRWQADFDQPLPGWHAHAEPFAMAARFTPAAGIDRLRTGTPPVLSVLALEAALAAFDDVDLGAVRRRSVELTGTLIAAVDALLGDRVEVVSPRDDARRGSQVSLRHPQAYAVVQAMIARGVVGDFRTPDVIRLGVAPLYVDRVDVVRAVEVLRAVLDSGEHRAPEFSRRATVT